MEKVLALEGGCPEEELEYIGSSIPFSRYHFTEEDVKRLKSFFVPHYTAHCREKTAPYEGIPEVLSALRSHGILTAVASNKDDRDVQVLARTLSPASLTGPWAIIRKSGASRRRIWYWPF